MGCGVDNAAFGVGSLTFVWGWGRGNSYCAGERWIWIA